MVISKPYSCCSSLSASCSPICGVIATETDPGVDREMGAGPPGTLGTEIRSFCRSSSLEAKNLATVSKVQRKTLLPCEIGRASMNCKEVGKYGIYSTVYNFRGELIFTYVAS